MICPLLQYYNSVHTTSERLNGCSQIRSMWQRYEWLLVAQALRISQWYLLALLRLFSQFIEHGEMFLIGLQLAGSEEEVLCQVSVVESRNGRVVIFGGSDE